MTKKTLGEMQTLRAGSS